MSAQAQVIPINREADLDNKALTLYEQATSIVIVDQVTYGAAGEVGKMLKSLVSEITDFHEPMRISAKAVYDSVLKSKNDALAPVNEAIGIVRATMNTYAQEQDRIRREKERITGIAAADAARKEREKLEVQAMKAMESGKDEKAESLMEKAENVYVAPVYVAPTIDKTVKTASGNITQSKETHITVTDIKAFVAALVAQNSAMTMIDVKAAPLKAWVKSNAIESFPGLQINRTVGVRI